MSERPEGITAETEKNAIRTIAGDDDIERYRLGVAYRNILDFKLYEDAGFSSPKAFIDDVLSGIKSLSQSSLSTFASIARNFSEEQATRYGTSALRSFLTWRKVRGDLQLAPEQAIVQVPGKDGQVGEKPFGDCSVSEVRAAIRHLRAPAAAVPEAVLDRVEALQAALDEVLGADHPSDIRAQMRKGEATVSFEGLPVEQLPAVLEALRTA